MIGDPSGKSSERKLLDAETIAANSAALRRQLERFLDFSPGPTQPLMVNNLDWLGPMSVIDFLRDIGKYFTVPYMLAKDSVQARLQAGMSFTEFSYQTLQAADFLHLHQNQGVDMQMGGADQWGNITAGLELIRRVESREGDGDGEAHEPSAFGLCSPLLLNRAGQKMGKSEKGAVFLDGELTSPYDFYQYWINDDDELVIDHLRWLTTKGREEIDAIAAEHAERPEARAAQTALALDLTARIHGAAEADRQVAMADAAFATSVDRSRGAGFALRLASGASSSVPKPTDWTAIDVAVAAAGSSRGEARRLISQGGFSINGEKLTDPAASSAGAHRWSLLVGRDGQEAPLRGSPLWVRRAAHRNDGADRTCGLVQLGPVAPLEDIDDVGRREAALGAQHQRVVEQVGQLAGQLRSGSLGAGALGDSHRPWRPSPPRSPLRRPCVRSHRRRHRASEVVYEPSGRVTARSSMVAQSCSSQAKSWRGATGTSPGFGIETGARLGVAGRTRWARPDEDRIAVAIELHRVDRERVAARLTLPPERIARARVEVRLAGPQRRLDGLGILPGDHQHATIGSILHDGCDEPVGTVAHRGPDRARAAPIRRPLR